MGRNSYDEIGRPLPNRETIVISNTKKYIGENLHTASSVKEAIDFAKECIMSKQNIPRNHIIRRRIER